MKLLAFVLSFSILSLFSIQHSGEVKEDVETKIEGKKSFAQFLRYFEKSEKAISIDVDDIEAYKQGITRHSTRLSMESVTNEALQDFLPLARKRKFSRMGAPIITPLYRFYPNEKMVAVTYLSRGRFMGKGFSVMLSIFDLKGNLISISTPENDHKNAFKLASYDPIHTVICTIESAQKIVRRTLKNEWAKDIAEFGIRDNTIIGLSEEKVENITIDNTGKLIVNAGSFAHVQILK